MNRSANTPVRIGSLEVLRGIGALWVCGLHARAILWVGLRQATEERSSNFDPQWWAALASYPFSFGGAGVQLFFVLSGYCIHRSTLNRGPLGSAANSYAGYFLRRFSRIYPVLLASLVLTALFDQLSAGLGASAQELGDRSLAGLLSNVLSLQGVWHDNFGSNVALWSLAVELHLYVAYPLLVWVLERKGLRLLLVGSLAVSVASQVLIEGYLPQLTLFAPYLFNWTLGLAVAEGGSRFRSSRWRITIYCLLLLGAFAAQINGAQFIAVLLQGISFAGFLHTAARADRPFVPRLVWRALLKVGEFSYSLYACHVPVLLALRYLVWNGKQSSSLLAVAAGGLVCLTVGWALYATVERPFLLRMRKQASRGHPAGSRGLG